MIALATFSQHGTLMIMICVFALRVAAENESLYMWCLCVPIRPTFETPGDTGAADDRWRWLVSTVQSGRRTSCWDARVGLLRIKCGY
jgi:hypothetical protein